MKLDSPLANGEVALVGAGPGCASLLTLAAAKLIGDCDTIVYDALVSEEVLDMAPVGVELVEAGKRGGRPSASQDDICKTLIDLAKNGNRVVRLKGGDPFVFGRGGEEVRALAAAGIRFRIIPGITAGIAAPAMAGIPVTDRSVNATLAFLTGHEASEKSRMDWRALVEAFPVLVFYMGARNLSQIAARLLEAGLAEQTPLAIIHAATLNEENTTIATLHEAFTGRISARSPSILIVGDVVAKRINWKD
ncbi:uroporphyrinogen-III C-methyltransferase [Mariprofundus ferrinatatus]|uniref:uroporphyrinogen-III C-methyltransferase n=1 Tax=Mariprofundus ferrinatatus TaxID=1921087 RepID=A0A2K8L692_9PROT|nr:uroporphyrinogen-III C-methyltransferase [Mariprofundus ferrinatatus]ATX82838.1 uroporphyrinogen-III C-methyltransferase [Mariprofundus ferrinatatus]